MNYNILKEKFPKVHETINNYYGIDNPSKYDIEKLMVASHLNDKYVEFWKIGVLKKIEHELNIPTRTLTFGLIPNYGGKVDFRRKIKFGKFEVFSIHFYVSLLNQVYTMQILDMEESFHQYPQKTFRSKRYTLKKLWVSPEGHPYEKVFLDIKCFLEQNLNTPLYLPYSIQEVKLIGLRPPSSAITKNQYCVRDAFFNMVWPQYTDEFEIIGNKDYMIENLK